MTEAEAHDLAKRIVDYWRRGPIEDWIEALTPLDVGTTGTAFVRLRASEEHPPTIARFMQTYRALRTSSTEPTERGCSRCADGWLTREFEQNGHTYRGCVPCTCATGRLNEPVHASVLQASERLRARS